MKRIVALLLVLSLLACTLLTSCAEKNDTNDDASEEEDTSTKETVLVLSKTGKYDVTQNLATYVAWKNIYYEASMYWVYCKYDIYEDTEQITKKYTLEEFALLSAQSAIKESLRDSIDSTVDALIEWVAVCDAAHQAGVELDDADKAVVDESIDSLESTAYNYGYASLDTFLATFMTKGMKESDVRKAEQMSALYNKYCLKVQVDFEKSVTLEEVLAFRDEHPENYYKIDYLMFSAETKELADKYATAVNSEEFKEMILIDHFNDNYKAVFNKYTTQKTATNEYNAVKNLVDTDAGMALTDKLNALGVGEKKTYASNETLNEDLKKWLFSTARKNQEASLIVSDDVIFLAVFQSAEANSTSVEARVKSYEFVDGSKHEGIDNFKETLLKHLKETKKTDPDYPEIPKTYKEAEYKAREMRYTLWDLTGDALKAEFEKLDYKKVEDMTNTTDSEEIPSTLRDEIIAKDPKTGDVFQVDDGTTSYLVYAVDANNEDEVYTLYYVTYESDLYYQILDDISTSLEEVYPTEKTISPTPDAEAETFEAWISEHQADNKAVSLRREHDTKVFEVKTTDETTDVETTSYNAYMVVNTPMYLDKTIAVNGGYLLFSGTTGATNAEAAKEGLVGKTYAELLNALQSADSSSSPTVSAAITKDSLSEKNLQDWFFSDERQANDVAVVSSSNGSSLVYLAVYIGKGETWQNNATSDLIKEKMDNWIIDLTKDYSADEKALDKIGEPTPTTVPEASPETPPQEAVAFDFSPVALEDCIETSDVTDLVKIDLTYVDQFDISRSGSIIIRLYESVAPITVENFQNLVAAKYYDGSNFHRVYKNFVIQGGISASGQVVPNIKGEFSANGVENNLLHVRGVVSMARASDPDSASSQFFIMHADSYPSLDGQYASFGYVVCGMDVVDAIAEIEVRLNSAMGGEISAPVYPVTIVTMSFVKVTK